MTPQEYASGLDALEKKRIELGQQFIKDNPFKELEGKLVYITMGCSKQKVLFEKVDFVKECFGEPDKLGLFFRRLKKDGTPRKDNDFISVRLYDGKFYRIEKL